MMSVMLVILPRPWQACSFPSALVPGAPSVPWPQGDSKGFSSLAFFLGLFWSQLLHLGGEAALPSRLLLLWPSAPSFAVYALGYIHQHEGLQRALPAGLTLQWSVQKNNLAGSHYYPGAEAKGSTRPHARLGEQIRTRFPSSPESRCFIPAGGYN